MKRYQISMRLIDISFCISIAIIVVGLIAPALFICIYKMLLWQDGR